MEHYSMYVLQGEFDFLTAKFSPFVTVIDRGKLGERWDFIQFISLSD